MLSINTNIAALFGANQFNKTSQEIDKLTQQISTGKRINTAGDDPAGVGIISTLKSQSASYNAVDKNISAAGSLLSVAATSLESQQTLLTQMKELATQGASDLLTADQRAAVQAQFAELQGQLDTSVDNANLFGQNLTGAAAADVDVQVGIEAGDTFTITAAQSDAITLGVDGLTVDLTDAAAASAAMTAIDAAIGTVAGSQSTIGTQQTGLDKIGEIARKTAINLNSATSRIEDADIAELSAKLAQAQVQQQLQVQMLQIANALPQLVLQLLR